MNTKRIKMMIALSCLGSSLAMAKGSEGTASVHTAYYKQLGPNGYLLSLLPGAKLIESLKAFQRGTKVATASLTGLGALKKIHIAQYRLVGEPLAGGGIATKPVLDDTFIEGHREIVSLVCNLTTNVVKGGAVSSSDPHCHVALAGSDDASVSAEGGYPVVGGHLVEAEVAVVAELFVTTYATPVDKKYVASHGGTMIDLDENNGGIPLN